MLDYYYGHQLFVVTMVTFGAVALNLLLAIFLPSVRKIIGYTVLLFGIVLVLNLVRYQFQLAFFGNSADGTVIEIKAIPSPSRSRTRMVGATFDYRPRIHFDTEKGRQIEFLAVQNISKNEYSVDDIVKVRYMPTHPEFAEIDSWRSLWRPLFFGIIFAGLICFAGVLLIRSNPAF